MAEAADTGGDGSVGLRERKKADTRRRLVVAARELALARGADAVTVDDVARAADVSVRTFFNYFCSKDDALVGIDPAAHTRLRERILGHRRSESPSRILLAALTPDATDDETVYLWALRTQLAHQSPALRARHLLAVHELAVTAATALRERLDVPADDPTPDVVAGAVLAAVVAATDHALHPAPARFDTAIADAFATLRKVLR